MKRAVPGIACIALAALALAPAVAGAKPCTLGVDLSFVKDRAPSPCGHNVLLGTERTAGPIAPGPGDGVTFFATERTHLFAARMSGSGQVTRFGLPEGVSAVYGVAAGPDGAHWFTAGGAIGRIAADGTIAMFPVQAAATGAIAAGPDGALWFPAGSAIGRISTAGEVRLFAVPVKTAGGIASGPGNALWFSAGDHVGRLTTGGAVRLFALPGSLRADGEITAAGDGALWFTDGAHGRVGRLSTAGRTRAFGVPGTPVAITRGPDPATVWLTINRGNVESWVARMTVRSFSSQRPHGLRCDAGVRPACWFLYPTLAVGDLTRFNTLSPTGGVTVGADKRIWFAENRLVGTVIPFRGVRVCAGAPSTSDLVGVACPHPAVPTFRVTHGGSTYVQLTCPRFTLRYCAGSIELRDAARGRFLGDGHYVLHTFDNPRARVALNSTGRSLVKRGGLLVTATMRAHDAAGLSSTISSTIVLRLV